MTIDTARFGRVDINDEKILSFRDGLPGLEEHRRFAILRFDESYPILWLQSLDGGGVCLPVVDSFLAVQNYAFDIGDEDAEELCLRGPEDLQVISVLVITENIEEMTVNLVAPIIINIRTGAAKQIILNGSDYNVRFPIFAELCRLVKEGGADAGSFEKAE